MPMAYRPDALDSTIRAPNQMQKATSTKAVEASRAHAQQKCAMNSCRSPKDNGDACGVCCECCQILRTICQQDGLRDIWDEIIRPCDAVSIRAADLAYIYDWSPAPLYPPAIGAPFVQGVSQVVIYHPAASSIPLVLCNAVPVPTMTILTPDTLAEFPTAAQLNAGEFAVYFPNGTGVNNTTPIGKSIAFSGITVSDVAIASSSYTLPIPPLIPPALLLNSLWRVSGQDSLGNKILTRINISQFRVGWFLQVGLVMTSTTVDPTFASPSVLRVVGITFPGAYWELGFIGFASFLFLTRIFLTCLIPNDCLPCGACCSGRGNGCGDTRCGKRKSTFSVSPHIQIVDGPRENSFAKLPSEIDMLENVLNNKSTSYHGLTIHKQSKVVVKGNTSDNLIFSKRSDLVAALKNARANAQKVELVPAAALNPGEIGADAAKTATAQKAMWAASLNRFKMEKMNAKKVKDAEEKRSKGISSATDGASKPDQKVFDQTTQIRKSPSGAQLVPVQGVPAADKGANIRNRLAAISAANKNVTPTPAGIFNGDPWTAHAQR